MCAQYTLHAQPLCSEPLAVMAATSVSPQQYISPRGFLHSLLGSSGHSPAGLSQELRSEVLSSYHHRSDCGVSDLEMPPILSLLPRTQTPVLTCCDVCGVGKTQATKCCDFGGVPSPDLELLITTGRGSHGCHSQAPAWASGLVANAVW